MPAGWVPPLDSLLRLIDTTGRVVAWNDDHEDMESGLLTHQADSYLSAKLPANGRYFVQLTDAEQPRRPGIQLLPADQPSAAGFRAASDAVRLNVPAGRAVTMTVYAVRKDGWDGDIDIALKDAPPASRSAGRGFPRAGDQVRMTLQAPRSSSAAVERAYRLQRGGQRADRRQDRDPDSHSRR